MTTTETTLTTFAMSKTRHSMMDRDAFESKAWTRRSEHEREKDDDDDDERRARGGVAESSKSKSKSKSATATTTGRRSVMHEKEVEYENLTWEEIIERECGAHAKSATKDAVSMASSFARRYDESRESSYEKKKDDDSQDYWETRMQPQRCVVIGVGKKGEKKSEKNANATFSVDDSMSELERLCDAAGLVVVGRVTPSQSHLVLGSRTW